MASITIDEINTAIRAVLEGGQSYTVGGRTFTRANLNDLYALKRSVTHEVSRASSGITSVMNTAEGTYESDEDCRLR